MNNHETTGGSTGDQPHDSALDRAAAQGPLPEAVDDDEPGGGAREEVEDSTEQEAHASFLGIHLNP